MARSLVLGNGNMLVCLDEWGQLRDFYFPRVGLENHVGEHLMHRIGVYADSSIHWLSSGEWVIQATYAPNSLVSEITAEHAQLGLTLHFTDAVYNERDIFIRQITVTNKRNEVRHVRLFFNQQFHISENKHGDTGYYSPELHAIIHYKGRRVILIGARSDEGYFQDYSIGLLGIEGKEGTWRDAEDGVLSKSAVEHGTVDSVLGQDVTLASLGTCKVSYWIAAGTTYRHVEKLHRDIITRSPEHLIKTTTDFWHAWVNRRDVAFCGADQKLIELYKRSLFIMRAHTDNRGAIIASGDSSILQNGRDTYCYCWPRDAAYIVRAYLSAGHTGSSNRFHTFCHDLLTEDGYLLHKYRADRSLGSSWHAWVQDGRAQPPIQEDETAITLVSLYEHYQLSRDVEYVESIFNIYIKKAADFLARYRDKKTGLPLPSHDLWEEDVGVYTYTACVVYAGLVAASQFAGLLGKEVARVRWQSAADELRNGILTTLVTQDGRAMKVLRFKAMNPEPDYTVDASTLYGLFTYGILTPEDPRLVATYERTISELTAKGPVGGIVRYTNDRYFRVVEESPNPWVITTLWCAEYEIARATTVRDLDVPLSRLRWVAERASAAGLLAEQYNPQTGQAISVNPLVWSHAQYVIAFNAYVEKLQKLSVCDAK